MYAVDVLVSTGDGKVCFFFNSVCFLLAASVLVDASCFLIES